MWIEGRKERTAGVMQEPPLPNVLHKQPHIFEMGKLLYILTSVN